MVRQFTTNMARIYNGGKDSLCNQCCWENWTATHNTIKLDHCLTSYTKIDSKLFKVLTKRPEIINQLVKDQLLNISLGNEFLDLTPKAKQTKANIDKLGFHQTKKLLHSKGKKKETAIGEGGKINISLKKRKIKSPSKYYKKLINRNLKGTWETRSGCSQAL